MAPAKPLCASWVMSWCSLATVAPPASASLALEVAGQWGGQECRALAVQGNRAYAGFGPSLIVFDISDRAAPVPISHLDVENDIQGIAVSDGHAFLADGAAGLIVVDIASPCNPWRAGSLPLPNAVMIVAYGSYCVVADAATGLRVVDVSDPAAPVEVGQSDAVAAALTLLDHYALVAAGTNLLVLDLSDLPALTQVASFDLKFTAGLGWETRSPMVIVDGQYAYCFGGHAYRASQIHIWGVTYYDSFLHDVVVVDVSDPTYPVEVQWPGPIPEGGGVVFDTLVSIGIAGYRPEVIVGDEIFLVHGDGFEIMDIFNRPEAVHVGEYNRGIAFEDLAFSTCYAYAVLGPELQVLDLRSFAKVAALNLSVATGLHRELMSGRVVVAGNRAYVGGPLGLEVIDITDPLKPAELGNLLDEPVMDLAVSGSLVYALGVNHWRVVDFTDPHDPQILSSSAVLLKDSLELSWPYVYVTGGVGLGLDIFDVSNPVSPVALGHFDGLDYWMAVSGAYAYGLGAQRDGSMVFRSVDVSNPATPVQVAQIPLDVHGRWHVAAQGHYAYVLVGDGLRIIDLADPSVLPVVASADVVGGRVAVFGDLIGVIGRSLVLLRMTGGDFDGIPATESCPALEPPTCEDEEIPVDGASPFPLCGWGVGQGMFMIGLGLFLAPTFRGRRASRRS